MEAVENGMIVGYQKYDPQEQEQNLLHCDHCGDDIPESETVEINGDIVCNDCLGDYCNGQYDTVGPKYIAKHEDAFYLVCYFPNLSKEEQLEIIQAYHNFKKKRESRIPNNPRFRDMVEEEKKFCIQSDDWEEFVQEQLS